VRFELTDEVVNGLTSLDEEDDSAGGLEALAELLDGVSADDVGAWNQLPSGHVSELQVPTLGLVLQEVVDLGGGSEHVSMTSFRVYGNSKKRAQPTGCTRRP